MVSELSLHSQELAQSIFRSPLLAEVRAFYQGHICKVEDKNTRREFVDHILLHRGRTTKPEPGHKIYPYLLRGLAITRSNQVWAMDITYIAMARGFVYLAVAIDWFT
jgi:putative transposase